MIAGFSFQGTEMVGVAAVNQKIRRRRFRLQLNRFSGEFYYSISCVFSLSAPLLPMMIQTYYKQQQQKILLFSPFTLLYEK